MADVPGGTSTNVTVAVGSTTSGTLEVVGDHDWYKINLTAGQSITVTVNGVTLEDPYLYIHNSAGRVLSENDDINPGALRDSRLSFTAASTGVYYIDVGAFDSDDGGPGDYTGTYQLIVGDYTAPPVVSVDAIANQLVNGYWGGPSQSHHFNVTQGGTITVNLTGLTAAGQSLARAALGTWTDVIGVTFQEVGSGGQITFDDNEDGAFTQDSWTGHITDSAHVNISTQWLANYGTSLNSYSFQTYIHEIGHALGLGHAGNYNETANYSSDALFANDAWSTSIMSYFSPTENSYFAGQGFTENFVATPMIADIAAVQLMYGLSTTTRTGNTTYGFNSNAGPSFYHADQFVHVAYTIFDSGGTDTLDYSGFANEQVINLNSESLSNIGPEVGNVSIGRGVVIENAIGGSGHDTLIGNSVNNVMNGGGGVNVISYAAATAGATVNTSISGPQNTIGAGTDTLLNYNTLIGSAFNDRLTGGYFQGGQILIYAGAGDDVLIADANGSTLFGEAGDDWFIDAGGNDSFVGGNGFDTVDYSHLSAAVDTAGGGGVGFDTNDSIEQLIGSGFADTLSGASVLQGRGGNDKLLGSAGADALYGDSGTDSLNGGIGADVMRGGLGNDTYYVDNSGDRIAENSAEGTDLVYSSVTYVLTSNTENLTLTGLSDLSGRGNEIANVIRGNSGANSLYGRDGSDKLSGNLGADNLDGGNGNDVLEGGLDADRLYGRQGDDVLKGGEGNDWLEGGADQDRHYGGSGADKFVFRPGDLGGLTGATCDRIHDFSQAGGDRIVISPIDADETQTGDQEFTFIGSNSFSETAGELRYYQISGLTYIQGDTDGDGAADLLLRLDGLHSLTTGDFIL